MTHFPARLDAPIACDMTTAVDTPEERLAAYRELFARSLVRRQRAVVFTFDAGALEVVEELARREAACCPFADYRVEATDEEVTWTIAGPEPVLDAFEVISGATDHRQRPSS
jgi:hypothetical protein